MSPTKRSECARCNTPTDGGLCAPCIEAIDRLADANHRPAMEAAVPLPVPRFSQRRETCLHCDEVLPQDRVRVCEKCDGKIERLVAERVERDRIGAVERELRRSGLPRAYMLGQRTLAHADRDKTRDAVTAARLVGGRIPGLYLYGEAGSFKTSVAAGLLAERINAGESGRYVFVPDLFTDLFAIYASEDQKGSRRDLVEPLIQTHGLVLDDLGKEKASDHAASVIFEILDGRYRQKSTSWLIVTSNLPISELAGRFPPEVGEPIARRLSELCVPTFMEKAV